METPELTNTDQQVQQLKTWLAAVSLRDAAAFRSLYDATSAKLFGFALRILNKKEWAEEVLQESFVSIWNNASSYQPALAAPMTWMTTIVRNKAFDMLRRVDNAVEIDAENFERDVINTIESPDGTPFDALQLSDNAKALAICMRKLDGLHQQVIALAFFHDLSHGEVASHLKLPVGTVKTWIRRGLERLKNCLLRREDA